MTNFFIIYFFNNNFFFILFNRYSNYGNDAIVHMYFIIFIIVFLEINFNKITFDHTKIVYFINFSFLSQTITVVMI